MQVAAHRRDAEHQLVQAREHKAGADSTAEATQPTDDRDSKQDQRALVALQPELVRGDGLLVREDEIAASSSGINLANTKLFAFGAGAFFSGIAGAYHASKLGAITPDNFSTADSIIYLAMVVIGGIGSIPGVIVGAIVVYSINLFILAQLDSIASNSGTLPQIVLSAIQQLFPSFTYGSIRNLIFGIVLVSVMLFRPEGLIPSARRRRELHRAENEDTEFGALDAPPGAPGMESEMRV